jgi:hypothetical protein
MERMIMMKRRHPLLQGRAAGNQPVAELKPRPDRATRDAMKEDRARDAALAMKEYEADKRAVLTNTERLRALRLAKEAGAEAPKKIEKTAKKDR